MTLYVGIHPEKQPSNIQYRLLILYNYLLSKYYNHYLVHYNVSCGLYNKHMIKIHVQGK